MAEKPKAKKAAPGPTEEAKAEAPKPAPPRVTDSQRAPTASAKPSAPVPTVVDVSGLILGRAASRIAKRLLGGESIVVLHAEKSVVTGARTEVLGTYRANRARGSVRSGPHFPRYPDRIFRRTVRGMLPHLKTRGRQAFDRLEVYIGCPPEYASVTPVPMDEARARPAQRPPITLEEISRSLGARL